MAADYRLVLVDRQGVSVGRGELVDAKLGTVRWRLNEAGSFEFTMGVHDSAVFDIKLIDTEVQVYRGSQTAPLWWGVVTKYRGDADRITFTCEGLLWYFFRRHVGRAGRVNYLENPSFESGPGGTIVPQNWSVFAPNSPDAVEVLTVGDAPDGARVLNLYHPVADANTHIYQRQLLPARIYWNVSAWHYVHSGGYVGPAFGDRGLVIDARHPTEVDGAGNPRSLKQVNVPIDVNVEKDTWVRVDGSIPTFTPEFAGLSQVYVEARLYVGGGTVRWDACTMARNEALLGLQPDQGAMVRALVTHAQDSAYGKPSLNIGVDAPDVGIIRQQPYRHFEHANVGKELTRWSGLSNGFDVDIVHPNATTRTLTAYHPQKGTYRAGTPLIVGWNCNLLSSEADGDETRTSITALLDADGSTREERNTVDQTRIATLLEEFVQAPPNTLPRELQAVADANAAVRARTLSVPSLVTTDPSLVGAFTTGDTVPIQVSHGYYQYVGDHRIVGIDLDPDSDRMTLTFNPPGTL